MHGQKDDKGSLSKFRSSGKAAMMQKLSERAAEISLILYGETGLWSDVRALRSWLDFRLARVE